jgi:hypothetical protein
MPMYSISMCSNTWIMFNLVVGSSFRWLAASAMTSCHHFDSTSDPEPPNMTQVVWVLMFKAATLCPWKAHI